MRKGIFVVFSYGLVLLFVFSYLVSDHQELIAHRGLVSRLHTENTVSSFIAAARSPRFSGIETDLQDTKDGEIMVFHDLTMNDKTNGTGMLNDHTYHYIKHVHYHSGASLPTFSQYLRICRAYHKQAFIELKQIRDQRIPKVMKEINAQHMTKQAVILSSIRNQIKIIRDLNPKIKAYYITWDRPVLKSDFRFARHYHCGIDAQMQYLTMHQVHYARKKHIPFAIWVSNNPYDCMKMSLYHIHTITTKS